MAWLKRAARVGAVLYALYAGAMIWLHPRFIYPFFDRPISSALFTQHDLAEGVTLYAYDAGPDQPVILYFMGNAGALDLFLPMLDHHRAAGRSVVALGFRGGGGLPGTPSEEALKADALAAFDAISNLIDAPGPLVIQGYSLGTGLALHVAARRDVDGVILAAPYAKLCRLMAEASFLPACLLPGVQTWDNIADAPDVSAPVLILHGEADRLIPIAEAEELVTEIAAPLTFVTLPGTGHHLIDAPGYLPAIDAFLTSTPQDD